MLLFFHLTIPCLLIKHLLKPPFSSVLSYFYFHPSLPLYFLSFFMPRSLSVFLSTIQILTQEDWNVVLYNGMASTSPWAALYFVALMTFGNYVLFNLLVAILVEGFQAEVRTTVLLFGVW